MVRKVILVLFFILLPLMAGCGIFGQQPRSPTLPPPSAKEPSIYPGAQHLVIEAEGSHEPKVEKRITFQTSDAMPKVLQYYDHILISEGWKVGDWDDKPDNWLYYQYGSGPYYRFAVKVETTPEHQTNVTLTVQTLSRID